MPWKTWSVGEEVLAADFNDYIQEQVVARFATAAARATAIGTPTEGQASYLEDSGAFEIYNGTGWYPPWNTAWGQIDIKVLASSQTGMPAGFTALTGMYMSWTAIAGRQYETSLFGNVFSTASNEMCGLLIADGAGTPVNASYVMSPTDTVPTATGGRRIESALAGVVIRQVNAHNVTAGSGAMGVIAGASLVVADIGPI